MRLGAIILAGILITSICSAEQTRILRYPHYHQGTVVFSYMGDLWSVRDDSTELTRLTAHVRRDLVPQFSPDGSTIAFSGDRHGGFDVFVMAATGGPATRLTVHSGADFVVGWTPDGSEVLFVSGREPAFGWKLYKVSLAGGMPEDLGIGMSRRGTFSPDGTRMVFNRRGFGTWRKRYRGSANTDLWIVDLAAKDFSRLTDFDGQDAWPMWATESDIYFASDRSDSMNIWRISPEGGEPVPVTNHPYPGIKYPSISWDRKTIVYEFNSGLWKLALPDGTPAEIKLDLPVGHKTNEQQWLDFSNRMDDFSVDSAGKNVAFSVRGEIFSLPVAKGDMVRLTEGEARDRNPACSPDGARVAYFSDKDGEEKIYIAETSGGEPKAMDPAGNVHYHLMWSWGGTLTWSPDGKKLAYGAGRKICVYDIDQETTIAEIDGVRGTLVHPAWSPDGRWLAYSRRTPELQFDIFAVNLDRGIEYRLTEDAQQDFAPTFTPDGKGMVFTSNRDGSYQLYHFPFDKRDYDPSDAEEGRLEAERKKKEEEAKKNEEDTHGTGLDDVVIVDISEPEQPEIEEEEAKEEKSSAGKVTIDTDDLQQRIRRIARVRGELRIGPLVQKDGTRVIFSVREPRGTSSVNVVYSAAIDPVGDPASDLRELTTGGDIRALDLALDADMLFLQDGIMLNYMPAKGGPRKPISYKTRIPVDQQAEREQIFNEVWRALRDGFYDTEMHGTDWETVRETYHSLLGYVVDKNDLAYLINEMLGELNASHMGYSYPPASPDANTRYLGIETERDAAHGLYQVSHIYPEGPADKDYIDLRVGDYILEIDGLPLTATDNLYERLNNPLNEKVGLLVNEEPDKDSARMARITHIDGDAQWALFYKDWVRTNREHVEKASGGRIGYLHIRSMSGPALDQFKKDLAACADKEALIVDVRYNGGGNIEQQLLDILERRRYQRWVPRDIGEEHRPHEGFFGPKAVLANESSASNAEMFPAGFRELGLGKVIGVPTTGAVIGTTSYGLIDGSSVRMPQVGVSLLDGTNMENLGIEPDIYVEISPSDELNGKDPQLDAAVRELLKELETAGETAE